MSAIEISAVQAAELVRQGGRMVDIRESEERRSGVIPGAGHAPLSALHRADLDLAEGGSVVFHCQKGGRTTANATALAAKAGGRECFLLKGGIEAWRAAGLPVEAPR